MDDALDKLVNGNLYPKDMERHLYRFNVIEYLFRELFREHLGSTFNKRIQNKNEIVYNYLEVIKNLTLFQQTLFTNEEKKLKKKTIFVYKNS